MTESGPQPDGVTFRALPPLVIVLLLLASGALLGAVLYLESSNTAKTQDKALEMVAGAYATSLQTFRSFYSEVILEKLHGSDVAVVPDYADRPNAIPIPATMTLDLARFLNDRNVNASIRLISQYPFPWREKRDLSAFDERALEAFTLTRVDSYSEVLNADDRAVYEYAVPIRMAENCVTCHNTHPDTPKDDWRLGDIRGIQVVTLRPEMLHVQSLDRRVYLIIAILLFFAVTFATIFWLFQRNQQAFQRLMQSSRQLMEARDTAERASLAKSEFVAKISHEIRTPLNAIIGFSDILRGAKLPATEQQQAQIIASSAAALMSIIDDVLDFSKIESGRLEIVPEANSLPALLDQLHTLFSARASGRDIAFNKRLDPDIPPYLEFDITRLRQVLANLLSNAIKFCPAEGQVSLEAVLLSRASDKASIYLEVADTGIGISPDRQEDIFQPFAQADGSINKSYGGTGLGLTIVSLILQQMGSQIHVNSQEGKGSRFFFVLDLPIAEAPAEGGAVTDVAALSNGDQALAGRILVAEDNPVNRQLMVAMLRKLGLTAEYAENGRVAVDKVRDEGPYNLIFMDINMPECDGVTATREIREIESARTSRSNIVALTANVIKGDRERFLNAGMDDYLGKPIMFDGLAIMLDRYLEKRSPTMHSGIDLQALADTVGLDEDTMRELIDSFLETIDADIAAIQTAIDSGDPASIRDAAHYLKGAATNLGLDALAEPVKAIEMRAREGASTGFDLSPVTAAVATIRASL